MTVPAAVRSESPNTSPQTPPQTALRRSRSLLIAAAVLAAAWTLALVLLAVFTANPVMLNRDQILRARYVVTGTVTGDPASGRVAVDREWRRGTLAGEIIVKNLSKTGARTGRTYLIPLVPSEGDAREMEIPLSEGAPLIYPATPAALDQLRTILTPPPAPPIVK